MNQKYQIPIRVSPHSSFDQTIDSEQSFPVPQQIQSENSQKTQFNKYMKLQVLKLKNDKILIKKPNKIMGKKQIKKMEERLRKKVQNGQIHKQESSQIAQERLSARAIINFESENYNVRSDLNDNQTTQYYDKIQDQNPHLHTNYPLILKNNHRRSSTLEICHKYQIQSLENQNNQHQTFSRKFLEFNKSFGNLKMPPDLRPNLDYRHKYNKNDPKLDQNQPKMIKKSNSQILMYNRIHKDPNFKNRGQIIGKTIQYAPSIPNLSNRHHTEMQSYAQIKETQTSFLNTEYSNFSQSTNQIPKKYNNSRVNSPIKKPNIMNGFYEPRTKNHRIRTIDLIMNKNYENQTIHSSHEVSFGQNIKTPKYGLDRNIKTQSSLDFRLDKIPTQSLQSKLYTQTNPSPVVPLKSHVYKFQSNVDQYMKSFMHDHMELIRNSYSHLSKDELKILLEDHICEVCQKKRKAMQQRDSQQYEIMQSQADSISSNKHELIKEERYTTNKTYQRDTDLNVSSKEIEKIEQIQINFQ